MLGLPLPFPVPSWALKALGIAAAIAVVLFAVHVWIGALQMAAVAKVSVKAEHAARVTERKVASITTASALKEAKAQSVIHEKARIIHEKVYIHVKDHLPPVGCITFGFLRSLDAAGLGVDPAGVELPPGQSDDACAPLSAADYAAAIGDRFSDARANAEQLDALEADVKARIDAENLPNGKEKPQP